MASAAGRAVLATIDDEHGCRVRRSLMLDAPSIMRKTMMNEGGIACSPTVDGAKSHGSLQPALRRFLEQIFPALFYDPCKHYMKGPGPKTSLKVVMGQN